MFWRQKVAPITFLFCMYKHYTVKRVNVVSSSKSRGYWRPSRGWKSLARQGSRDGSPHRRRGRSDQRGRGTPRAALRRPRLYWPAVRTTLSAVFPPRVMLRQKREDRRARRSKPGPPHASACACHRNSCHPSRGSGSLAPPQKEGRLSHLRLHDGIRSR